MFKILSLNRKNQIIMNKFGIHLVKNIYRIFIKFDSDLF